MCSYRQWQGTMPLNPSENFFSSNKINSKIQNEATEIAFWGENIETRLKL